MRRLLALAVVAVVGLAVGAGLVLAWPEPPSPTEPTDDTASDRADGGDAGVDATDAVPAPAPQRRPATQEDGLLLAWTSGGLPHGFAARLDEIDAVTAHTVAAGDLAELAGAHHAHGTPAEALDDGWVIPLDALAVDPDSYAEVVGADADALADLDDDEAVLGATSAELRGLEAGATLELAGGDELGVTGVIDDAAVGAAEVVVTRQAGRRLGVDTDRFVLLRYDGDRAAVEQAVRDRLPDDTPARLRAPGETPYLRHGDAVLPQALVKARFGEFAYQRHPDGRLTQDPDWRRDHLTTGEVPLLGAVRCHRAVLADLAAALEELAQRGLGDLVDADGFGGCHNARLTRAGDAVSRHAWGIAADLNVADNPLGTRGNQDARLIATFEDHGFGWGGEWLVPDPHHFEHTHAIDP